MGGTPSLSKMPETGVTFRAEEQEAMGAGEEAHAEFLLDKFPELISGYFHKKPRRIGPPPIRRASPRCAKCNSWLLGDHFDDGDWVCVDCGTCSAFLENTTRTCPFNTVLGPMPFKYKRSNHFKDWIQQVNGEEDTVLPDEVIEGVLGELKKHRMKPNELTVPRVKRFLKALRMNKHYENAQQIVNIVSKKKPERITPEQADKLMQLFEAVQEPFESARKEVCPNRKNFFSYPYILIKMCELLGFDEHIPKFTLLKSKGKVAEQDMLWKRVCAILHWEFIPTRV